jgi:hypothetical protein
VIGTSDAEGIYRLFTADCAERALVCAQAQGQHIPPVAWAAVDAARRYVGGRASLEDIRAYYIAVKSMARDDSGFVPHLRATFAAVYPGTAHYAAQWGSEAARSVAADEGAEALWQQEQFGRLVAQQSAVATWQGRLRCRLVGHQWQYLLPGRAACIVCGEGRSHQEAD